MISFCVLGCCEHFFCEFTVNLTYDRPDLPPPVCFHHNTENDLKVAFNTGMVHMLQTHAGAYNFMPIDSNGIWNVIRNVFSILYFCMKYTCVNKYIFDKSEIMNHHVYVFEWEGRASHGCRTCIERELIHHGNFSYFRSQKYEYKWIAKDQNPPIWGHISH